MVSRADRYTTRATSDVYFSDFFNNFSVNAKSGQLNRIINEDSMKQALKNLILTNVGERPYQPTVGGNVRAYLFEPIDGFTTEDLKEQIVLTIRNNEKRVDDLDVQVVPDEENNRYKINIYFTVFNSQTVNNLDLVLTRVR
jgi:phage baseplate assembly protein W